MVAGIKVKSNDVAIAREIKEVLQANVITIELASVLQVCSFETDVSKGFYGHDKVCYANNSAGVRPRKSSI